MICLKLFEVFKRHFRAVRARALNFRQMVNSGKMCRNSKNLLLVILFQDCRGLNIIRQRHSMPVDKANIVKSLRRLKSKSCDLDGICAAHLDPRSAELLSHLQLLFQMCLSRSIVPDSFLCGSVTSILKKGKDLNSCNSYRPIIVACTLSKLFEYVLLPHIDEFVNYEANQFIRE